MTDKKPKSEAKKLSFEEAFAKLEGIVRELEDGQLGLSESLARYEQGAECLRQCHESLEQAERKILLLTGVDAEGNPIAQPYDDQATTLEEKQASRTKRRTRAPKKKRAKPDAAEGKGDADVDNQRGLF